jgi:hypothetical protein
MVRVVRQAEDVVVDARQILPGRGAYVHPRLACMERAVRRGGLARTLKTAVPQELLQALSDLAVLGDSQGNT